MIKEKQCSGIGKAKTYKGCGKLTKHRKYGLCLNCYPTWLYSTDLGKLEIEKARIKGKKQVENKKKKERTELKESLKSISAVINDVKKEFQHFIRLRDMDLPCISCGANKCEEWAGGHFFKAEIYSGLIFDERNCHKQCNAKCNKYAQGAQLEYRMGLVNRYGEDFVKQLEADSLLKRNYKYTREELQQIKEKYKQKIKEII